MLIACSGFAPANDPKVAESRKDFEALLPEFAKENPKLFPQTANEEIQRTLDGGPDGHDELSLEEARELAGGDLALPEIAGPATLPVRIANAYGAITSSVAGPIYNHPKWSDPSAWVELVPGVNAITDGLVSAADSITHRTSFS
jgi:hypothetical protein